MIDRRLRVIARRAVSIIVAFALFSSYSIYGQDLVILYTNDTHSHMEPELSGKYKGLGGVQRRADYIKWVRGNNRAVLLLDAGDFNQGTPYYTLFKGDMEIELFNAMRYDAVSLGNHEFDNGVEELSRRLSKATFSTLCANYDFSATPLNNCVKPYTIISKGGYKIGIIGALVNLKSFVNSKVIKDIRYIDPVEPVNAIADRLKNEEGCDLVIVLSHLGYSSSEAEINSACDIELAKSTRNVDIIIGGHTHIFMNQLDRVENSAGNNVIITQMGFAGYYIGRIDIKKK